MTTTIPCSLCHYCVKVSIENHGSRCIWFNTFIAQDEVHSVTPLRERCCNDPQGDNFVWQMDSIGRLDYARWVQSVSQIAPLRKQSMIALSISIVSLLITVGTTIYKFFN